MKRFMRYAMSVAVSGMSVSATLAGEASTTASASNGWFGNGTAGATAGWDGRDGGTGYARTRTDTSGNINLARGVAVGVDEDGLDFSFSHALAPRIGPAYAGTLNLSIGTNGNVSGGYGGALANGGIDRAVNAGGRTSSSPFGGAAVTTAGGHTNGGGAVIARTHSYDRPVAPVRIVRTTGAARSWRR
jgi:hypothetical protein